MLRAESRWNLIQEFTKAALADCKAATINISSGSNVYVYVQGVIVTNPVPLSSTECISVSQLTIIVFQDL